MQFSTTLNRDDVYRRVLWRVVPFLLLCYLICRIDTAIVGYAKLEFLQQLHFSEAVYGFGAGVFYLGYALCEVPSNLYLEKYGVRRTLLRIMTIWGLITIAMMFMRDSTQFVLARFLLGMAEGGFFPGILLYLTYWLPPDKRATGFSIFIMANPIAGAIGGILSGFVMKSAGALMGLAGWQALFFWMGFPAIILGVIAYFYLTDKPETAPWLGPNEKKLVLEETATSSGRDASKSTKLGAVLKDNRVYVAALVYFSVVSTLTMFTVWAPTVVRAFGPRDLGSVGAVTAIPYLVGLLGLYLVGSNSDKTMERRWHFVLCALLSGVGICALYLFHSSAHAGIFWLSVTAFGLFGAFGVFFAIPATFLKQDERPAGLAVITTIGNLAGFFMPWLSGFIQVRTGNLYLSLLIFGVVSISGALLLAISISELDTVKSPVEAS